MTVTIPEPVISAFWSVIATGLVSIALLITGLRSKYIPLTWGKKNEDAMTMTPIEFDQKLQLHCTRRQQTLDAKLETINSNIVRTSDLVSSLARDLVDVRERLARIEGREAVHG